MTENTFNVPAQLWDQWQNAARRVFNETYEAVFENQLLYIHPKTPTIKPKRWKTTAWNVAVLAAFAAQEAIIEYRVEHEGYFDSYPGDVRFTWKAEAK